MAGLNQDDSSLGRLAEAAPTSWTFVSFVAKPLSQQRTPSYTNHYAFINPFAPRIATLNEAPLSCKTRLGDRRPSLILPGTREYQECPAT